MKRGDIILVEKPYAFILQSIYRKERCDYCFAINELKKCSKCNYVYYCGRKCQSAAWSMHKLECNNLWKISPKILPDSAHLLIRLFLRSQKYTEVDDLSMKKKSRTFETLMSHANEIKKDEQRMEHLASLTGVLLTFFGKIQMPKSDILLEIFGKMCTNSFNILDDDMNSIGTGVYLDASRLDHSCKPTAVAIFDRTTLYIRALEDMNDFRLENVRISYIDVMNTPDRRRKLLNKMYYFLCNCARCCDLDECRSMNSMKCPDVTCPGYVPILKTDNINYATCTACGIQATDSIIKIYSDVIQFSDHNIQDMQNKDMAYLDVCEVALQKQEGILHDYNIHKIKTLELAFEASIKLQRWQKAKEYGLKLHLYYKKYYGDFHPLLGHLYMKILKLLLLEGDIGKANVFYRQAHEIISVTHGQCHPLFHTLQSLLC